MDNNDDGWDRVMDEFVGRKKKDPITFGPKAPKYDEKFFEGLLASTSKGVKKDQGKTRYELLPPELLYAVSEILTFGANKYADRNWELGMNWSRVFGALMRHLWAWWNPFTSSKDEETGKSHLWHAGCCIAFLIAYEMRGVGTDDRPHDGGQKADGKNAP